MSGLWRSEEMQLLQLMIPSETAKDTLYTLGELGMLQFKDLNTEVAPAQRAFAYQVKRCDELTRKLRFFQAEVEKSGLKTKTLDAMTDAKRVQLDELEAEMEQLESELLTINAHDENLRRSKNELKELLLVIEKAGGILHQAKATAESEARLNQTASTSDGEALLPATAAVTHSLSFIAGTIKLDKVVVFHRMVLRVTRGNVLVSTVNAGTVTDPATGEDQEKAVFLVFFAGQRAQDKVLKICEAFGANRYPLAEDTPTRQRVATQAANRLNELGSTIDAASQQRKMLLSHCASHLTGWLSGVRMEKLVYHELNKCSRDVTHKVLLAEAWCPTIDYPEVVRALSTSGSPFNDLVPVVQPVPCSDVHPTYFRTNNFTSGFQSIIDAYGMARYQEVNPTVFSIMTFPFLFAVMFGDLGHGSFMFAFALFMVLKEATLGKQDLGDIFGMLFGGRYVILLMAIFSMFVGLIYNECFSLPMTLFGDTRYYCKQDPSITDLRTCVDGAHGYEPGFNPDNGPYPLGVDPIWHGTKSELPFLNSLKMKMSIILGVIQMDLGILMSLFNHLHYKDYLSIFCEFIPQVIFLNSIFGYLCFLMMYKWYVGGITDLYHVLIYMFLNPTAPLDPADKATTLFEWQGTVQPYLLVAALIAVPWMLIPKPLILKKRYEASIAHCPPAQGEGLEEPLLGNGHGHSAADNGHHGGGHGHGHGEEFNFGELAVHQMIHTIEFVLGAVSNTASYLRLWALSLAHSQLSAVFYDRVMVMTISMGAESGPTPGVIIAMMIGFIVFACATLGVLMVMESLSAFLHALRLHWVEFMNKFYGGDGYPFVPFAFKLLEEPSA